MQSKLQPINIWQCLIPYRCFGQLSPTIFHKRETKVQTISQECKVKKRHIRWPANI